MGAAGYQQPNDINVAVGYRWQYSDRHFTGEHEEPERQEEGSEVINDLHLIDLSVTYAINSRVSLSLLVPFQSATRSQTLRDDDDNIILRYETAASGLGDIRLLGTTWLLKPERNENQNISLGLGIDFPTGEKQ